MNERLFLRGGGLYKATMYILKRYNSINNYNVDIEGDSRQIVDMWDAPIRYNGTLSPEDVKLRYSSYLGGSCPICENMIRDMDEAFVRLKDNRVFDNMLYDVVYDHYISDGGDDETVLQRIKKLGCSKNSYYNMLEYGTTIIAKYFWMIQRNNKSSPFYRCDDDTCISIFQCMVITIDMHEPNNYCYMETLELLENYIKFKYMMTNGVSRRAFGRINENFRMQLRKNTMEWNSKELLSMFNHIRNAGPIDTGGGTDDKALIEAVSLYVSYLEYALEMLRKLGSDEEDAYELLYISYLDIQFSQLGFNERIGLSGHSGKTFYNKRQNAICLLSQVLWGPLAHRTCKSFFSANAGDSTMSG